MHISKILIFITSCLTVVNTQAGDGTRNTAFQGLSGSGTLTPGFFYRQNYSRGSDVAMQGNKILFWGAINSAPGLIILMRLNPDGSVDTTFGSSGTVSVNAAFFGGGSVTVNNSQTGGLVVNPDNTILAACSIAISTTNSTTRRFGVIKFTATGVRDTTFNSGTVAQGNYGGAIQGIWYITGGTSPFTGTGSANTIKLQQDGKIVVGGDINDGTNGQLVVLRLNADGTLDTTGFNSSSLSPAGAIPGLWYKADAPTTPSNAQTAYFATNSSIAQTRSIAIQPDGKIVIAACLSSTTPSLARAGIIRLTSAGKLDTTFNTSGSGTFGGSIPGFYVLLAASGDYSAGQALGIAVDASGNIIMGAYMYFQGSSTNVCLTVMCVDSTGVLNTSFNAGGSGSLYGGNTAGFWALCRNATLPYSTGTLTINQSIVEGLIIDPAGRIVISGWIQGSGGTISQNTIIVRLTAAGKLDTTFNASGSGNPYGGNTAGFYFYPTQSSGSFATGQGFGSSPLAVGTGQILVGGVLTGPGQYMVCASIIDKIGILQDTASPFNTSLNGLILTTTIDQAGKIVGAGRYGTNAMALRYNAASSTVRDNTFDTDGVLLLTSLTATSNLNKIINAASNTYLATGQSNNVFTTVKLNSSGALDTSFNGNGTVVETAITGTNAGFDMLLNGADLSVAGVTGATNTPTVLNYNSSTGARNSALGNNGLQLFSSFGTGTMYGINTTTSTTRYGAGQGGNTVFVRALLNLTGVFQDTGSPFNTSQSGFILTTTIDQNNKLIIGGQFTTGEFIGRYATSGSPVRDSTFNFGGGGIAYGLIGFSTAFNKIINSGTGYLAAGINSNQFLTALYTSNGNLNSTYGSPNGYVSESGVGVSAAYDMLLNGTALAVAGVTSTNVPSVINYNVSTGARSTTIGSNGLQTFSALGTGILYGIQTTTGTSRYGAGQANNTAFVRLLNNTAGILQDTAAPFNTGLAALLYSTTITQAGNLVSAGQYGTTWQVVSYTPAAARTSGFGSSGVATAPSGFTAGTPYAVVVDSAGRVIAVGTSTVASNDTFTLVRYASDGTSPVTVQEPTFGVGSALGVEVRTGDALLVPGYTTTGVSDVTPTVIAYNSSLTRTDADQYPALTTGRFYAVKETGIRSLYAAGSAINTAVLYSLLNGTGLLQDTLSPFDTGAAGRMYGGIYDNSSNIVLCGNYDNVFTVVRYTSIGQRNPFYVGDDGVLQEPTLGVANGYAITQDSSGSYYVAGESTVGGSLVFTVVKYLNTGVLDTTFGNGGIIQETTLGVGKGSAIKINTDGTVLVGGQTTVNGTLLPTLIAYDPDGDRLETFGTNGVQTFSQFGTGTLNGLTIINISTVAAAGQMGNVATVVEVGQSSNVFKQILSGL